MFTETKKEKVTNETISQQNVIAQNTKIIGDIISDGAFRIDGTIEGNVKISGKVVVGKNGFINGTFEGNNVDFEGKFKGKLNLTGTLTLKSTGKIEGEVIVNKLAVEPGATFNATCTMEGAVKELLKGGGRKTEKSA